MAAPTYIDGEEDPATNGASGASVVVTWGDITGEAVGDIAICFIYKETTAAYTATPPGWTQVVGAPWDQDTGGFKFRADAWYKRVETGEATATWSWTGSVWRYSEVHLYRGAAFNDPIITAVADEESAQNSNPVHPGLTIQGTESALIWAVFNFSDVGNTGAPTGFTYRQPAATNNRNILVYDDLSTSPGASGTVTGNLSGDIEYPLTLLLELSAHNKADIFFTGFETGDLSQCNATSGTVSVQSTTKRTGGYALRCNPTATTGAAQIKRPAATGLFADLGRTVETFYTFYFRVATLPGSTMPFVHIVSAGFTTVLNLNISSGGAVTLQGTTTSGTVATLSTGVWYRFDVRCTRNGTSGVRIDGGSETTVTATNNTQDWMWCGQFTGSNTYDFYFDDVVIGTAAMDDGVGPCVRMGVPIGAGNYTGWTGDNTAVDEIPHNSGTDYINSGTGAGDIVETYDMQAAATVGILGAIYALIACAIMAEASSTTTLGRIRLRSGSTDRDSADVDIGTTTYLAIQKLFTADPADAAAWTPTKFDAIEVGPVRSTSDTSDIRATAVYLHVCEDGVSTGGGDTPVTPDTATLTLATFAPSLVFGTVLTPATATLSTATFTPTIALSDHISVTPTTATLTLATFAPTLGESLTPTTAALTLATFAPTVTTTAHVSVTPTTAALTLSTFAPTVATGDIVSVTPDSASLVLTTFAPTVSFTAHISVTPATAALTLSTFAPTLGETLTPSTASLTLSTFAPTLNETLTPTTAALTLSTFAPQLGTGITVGTANLVLTGFAPTVVTPQTVTPTTAALVLTTFAPTATVGAPVILPGTARITLSAPQATLSYSVSEATIVLSSAEATLELSRD